MAAFPADPQPAMGTTVDSVASPVGGSVSFSPALAHFTIGNGWTPPWSPGYIGDVYANNVALTSTLTLPAGTEAFYLYAEPNVFGTFSITATAQDGTTSGAVAVNGAVGGEYFGFYGTNGDTVASVMVSADANAQGFAVGEFGINKASQSITWTQQGPYNYAPGEQVTLGASASSGLAVSYGVVSGPCTVPSAQPNSTLTITGAGSCVVEASQAGNDDYLAATAVSHTITINKAATTLSAAPQLVVFPPPPGAGLFQAGATLTSGGQPVAGETVVFSVGGTRLCSATTGANGKASCGVGLLGELGVILAGGYTARFAGDGNYLSSTIVAPVLQISLLLLTTRNNTHSGALHVEATLTRGSILYATVTSRQSRGVTRLVVQARRKLTAGRYALKLTLTGRIDRTIRRTVTLE
jgi:hypothetical protein